MPSRDRRTYLTGFILALVLTLIPFGIVYWTLFTATSAIVVIALAAIAQIVVQLRYFLHIDFKTTPRENLIALFFAAFLIVVMVGGSLWVLFDLHYRHAIDVVSVSSKSETAYKAPSLASSSVVSPARVVRDTIAAAASRTRPTSKVKATAA